jgi:Winged helix DNA-binding domain
VADGDALKARFAAQLLGEERAAGVAAVAERLLAVQAQDLRSAHLAIRARTIALGASKVDRALTDERSVVIGWLNRGTLQLVRREDYWWLHALTTPPLFTPVRRRLAQMEVSAEDGDRAVAVIERSLRAGAPLTRNELGAHCDAEGIPTAGQILVHLLFLACLHGVAVRGPMLGKQHAYVLAHDWLEPPPAADREQALAELARRYLAGHAPADERDLAKWAGLPRRDARSGLQAIASELRQREDGLVELLAAPSPTPPRAILLDRWDPLLVGWRSRDELLAQHPSLDDPMAHYQRFAYAEARAVGGWRLVGDAVAIEPFASLPPEQASALAGDAADLIRFLAA